MSFLDSCVIIDLQAAGSRWFGWADRILRANAVTGTLQINHVILAEIMSSTNPEMAKRHLAALALIVEPLTDAVAIRAGAAQRLYRQRGGPRSTIITDFLIGAHASVLGVPLITRDRQRFASYFPELELVAPEEPE